MHFSLGRWYLRQSRGTQVVVRTVPAAVAAYASAVVGSVIANSLDPSKDLLSFFWVTLGTTGVVAIALIFARVISEGVEAIRIADAAAGELEQKVFGAARTFAEDAVLMDIQDLAAIDPSHEGAILVPENPLGAMRALVRSAYRTLEAHFGEAPQVGDRIEFEVTFMTQSYIDGEITIAAWANRQGRRPASMNQRETNSKTYNTTVTAEVYRMQRPRPRIVEDTTKDQNYHEIYPGQKDRIRSSIIWPVFSSEHQLVGTMVMHCDQAGFFLRSQEKFWRELCEIYAKRLAQERLRLDKALRVGDTVDSPTAVGAGRWAAPPF